MAECAESRSLAVAEPAPAGANGYPYRPGSPSPPAAPVAGPGSPLPEQWSVPEVVELVKEIAAESSTAALLAMHESVCAIRRTGREADSDGSGAARPHRTARAGDLALALRALEAATDVAGSTTEQVNLALGEMNALARRANGGAEREEADRTLAEINHKIDGLRAALTATRPSSGRVRAAPPEATCRSRVSTSTSALEPRRDPTAARPRPWLKHLLFTGLVPKCTFFVSLLLIVFAGAQTSLNIFAQERALEAQLHRKGRGDDRDARADRHPPRDRRA
jgi:hypothetical protein